MNLEIRSDTICALLHPCNAEMPILNRRQAGQAETSAIIRDLHPQLILLKHKSHFDLLSHSMLHGISNGFLRDAQNLSFRFGG